MGGITCFWHRPGPPDAEWNQPSLGASALQVGVDQMDAVRQKLARGACSVTNGATLPLKVCPLKNVHFARDCPGTESAVAPATDALAAHGGRDFGSRRDRGSALGREPGPSFCDGTPRRNAVCWARA